MSTTPAANIKPDHKYQGKVRDGSALIESGSGTLGYQVMLACDDGRTFFTIWITEKNKEHAMKSFAALGVTTEQLQNPSYIEYQMGQDIVGRDVVFGTKEETYKDKTLIKVAWIAKPSLAADGNKAAAVARFFGSGNGQAKKPGGARPITEDDPITDDDIGF